MMYDRQCGVVVMLCGLVENGQVRICLLFVSPVQKINDATMHCILYMCIFICFLCHV